MKFFFWDVWKDEITEGFSEENGFNNGKLCNI